MSGGPRLLDFARRGLPAVLLLVVAASMIATLSPVELAQRARLFRRALAGGNIVSSEMTGFWFDPDYAAFLGEVARHTPRDATIALFVPPWPDVYVYQAAYQLAPRRVVDRRREREASWVAAYRTGTPGAPGALAIPHGTLARR